MSDKMTKEEFLIRLGMAAGSSDVQKALWKLGLPVTQVMMRPAFEMRCIWDTKEFSIHKHDKWALRKDMSIETLGTAVRAAWQEYLAKDDEIPTEPPKPVSFVVSEVTYRRGSDGKDTLVKDS